MRIIPAIDIIEGKCVRLSKGDYSTKKIYNEDPLEVAKSMEGTGIRYLHLVDLDGAKAKRVVNWKVLEKIASRTSLAIDFGGGIKSEQDLTIAFESGAQQVTGGSIAVKEPAIFYDWIAAYGANKIILGADALDGKIAVSGWQEPTDRSVNTFIKHYVGKGIEYVISTDISKDGILQGPSFELYELILKENSGVKLIASGGISSMNDIERLQKSGLEGVIIGKAIYEGYIKLTDLQRFL